MTPNRTREVLSTFCAILISPNQSLFEPDIAQAAQLEFLIFLMSALTPYSFRLIGSRGFSFHPRRLKIIVKSGDEIISSSNQWTMVPLSFPLDGPT